MKKIVTSFLLIFGILSFCENVFSATADSLSRTTPGQASLELSRMSEMEAVGLLSQMNPGIVAQIISPTVMESKKAAGILNQMPFVLAAKILAPTVTMPDNALNIRAEMVRQAPMVLVRGFSQPGLMDPAGTHEGNVAMFLSKCVSSDDAAKKLYSMKAATVARILAPTITEPNYAEAVWIAAAILDPVQMYLSSSSSSSVHQRSSYGEGGERGHGNGSQISGQALGVAAGDALDDFRNSGNCQRECVSWCNGSKDAYGLYLDPTECHAYCRDYVCNKQ